MASTHDTSELWKEFRTQLVADVTLAALLGGATEIYRAWPDGKILFPALIVAEVAGGYPAEGGATDLRRPRIAIDIFAVSIYTANAILGHLDEKWSIPHNKPAGVSSTNFSLDSFRLDMSAEVGPIKVVDTGETVRKLATEWNCRVRKIT